MQGGTLGDSHAVAEKSSKAGLLVEPMEKQKQKESRKKELVI